MATIGLSKPYYSRYQNAGNVVSYGPGGVMGKATEANINIETSEDNNLYADNGIAESDRSFSGGTLELSTDDLSQEVSKAILGLTENELGEIPGVSDTGVRELVYNDLQQAPYLGVGFIIKKKVNNVYKWRAVVLTKVMFSIPSDAATTQGETIEWQVPELSAAILRDDSAEHSWKREATFTTEAQAEAYIKYRLNVDGNTPTLGVLNVASAAGSTAGETALTVTPALTAGNHYVYQTGAEVPAPVYGADVSGWSAWNGTAEIASQENYQIVVVEADSENRAVAAGSAIVNVKAEEPTE